eukprot:symbB.v1.2.022837.t1/scaffold2044.1/size91226/3
MTCQELQGALVALEMLRDDKKKEHLRKAQLLLLQQKFRFVASSVKVTSQELDLILQRLEVLDTTVAEVPQHAASEVKVVPQTQALKPWQKQSKSEQPGIPEEKRSSSSSKAKSEAPRQDDPGPKTERVVKGSRVSGEKRVSSSSKAKSEAPTQDDPGTKTETVPEETGTPEEKRSSSSSKAKSEAPRQDEPSTKTQPVPEESGILEEKRRSSRTATEVVTDVEEIWPSRERDSMNARGKGLVEEVGSSQVRMTQDFGLQEQATWTSTQLLSWGLETGIQTKDVETCRIRSKFEVIVHERRQLSRQNVELAPREFCVMRLAVSMSLLHCTILHM